MKNNNDQSLIRHRSFGARLLLSLLCSALVTGFLDYVISEVFVFWYMHAHSITVRAELSEDMGFGMLGLFLFVLTVPVSLIVSFFICWKKFK